MTAFHYKGRNQRGESVTGQIEASTSDAVANQLFNSGITPVEIAEAHAGHDVMGLLSMQIGSGKVELTDLILFSRQMYTLLNAGVPIMQAFRGLQESTHNPALAKVLANLHESLDAGLDLSSSLRRHPKVFSSLYLSMIQVGETTGTLAEAFLQMAKYLELEKTTRGQIKSAMRYPVFVLIALAMAFVVINIWVVPAFAKVYSGFNIELPWATRVLMATSSFTLAYWPYLSVALIATVVWVYSYIKTDRGRYRWHKLKLRIPVIGKIIFHAALGRFARALSITMRAGVSIIQGMTVISRAVDNDYIGERIIQMRDGIERGENITRTAAATGLFPPLVIQMISVGEESGAVDNLMENVADYYEREVEYELKNLSASIEPILITGVAVLVFILALGVFLPMWDLVKIIK